MDLTGSYKISQSWLVAELEENQALATVFLLKNYD